MSSYRNSDDDSGLGNSNINRRISSNNVNDNASQIFAALDEEGKGFISSEEFLEKMLAFMSTEDNYDELNEDIIRLIKPYQTIRFEQFKIIFREILESNESRSQRNSEIVRQDSTDSCTSDIDNSEEHIYIVKDNSTYQHKPLIQLDQPSRVSASPKSAKATARDLTNHYQPAYNLTISTNEDNLLNKIDQLTNENETQAYLIGDLKTQLSEMEQKLINERNQQRQLNEKISKMEAQLDLEQIRFKEQIKAQAEEYKSKMSSFELHNEEKLRKYEEKYNQLEEDWTNLKEQRFEYEEEIELLVKQLKTTDRELKSIQQTSQDTERILTEYKKTSQDQITEIQSERDMLEMTIHELMAELQEIKHLPPVNSTSLSRSQSTGPGYSINGNRSRAFSDLGGNTTNNNRRSIQKLPTMSETSVPTINITNDTDSTRIINLLTQENRNLVERIAHLETVSFYQREKLEASANCLSLADEIEQLDVTEIKAALNVERETVKTLQKYMATLTTKLILAGHIDVFEQNN